MTKESTNASPNASNAPVITASEMKHLSGFDFLTAIASGDLPQPPIAELMDFRLTEVGAGSVVFEGRPGPQHYNPIGSVHGGYAATVLDSVMACAVHSTLPAGTGYTTLEFKVNFVRALTQETGKVRAESSVIHQGSRIATSEGRLFGEDGKLYAHGTTTCMIFPM
ncbi:PaaI family thioesterase [Pelagibius sp. Alg239-R121]|uniref:PaaI family thioesterase n=1 Tax=Pelagibius sp. Alg239-R121 TaxID=2993448 RepID=UPI0024A63B32|nr:PaaI family thioesterase [Pelagibius sp. Alg239-R121]